jgi:hypothetical protein
LKAMFPVRGQSPSFFVFAILVDKTDIPKIKQGDLRTMDVLFDFQGLRKRPFHQAISMMDETPPQGEGLQLKGPPSLLPMCKSMSDMGLTPSTFHEFWIRSAKIPEGDRSVFEHECLSRILEAFVAVDQINFPATQGGELLARRLQVIREARKLSASQPDYSSADHFMGWAYRKSSQGVVSELAAHVASELKDETAIMKEARKAREERQQQPHRGRGRGRGRHGEGAAAEP